MTRNAKTPTQTPARKFHTRIVMGAAHYGLFVTEEVTKPVNFGPDTMPVTTLVPTLALDLNELSKRGELTASHKSQIAETLCLMHGIGSKREVSKLRYRGKKDIWAKEPEPTTAVDLEAAVRRAKDLIEANDVPAGTIKPDHELPHYRQDHL